MMADKLERIYTIPLGEAYQTVRPKRAKRAVMIVRDFISRHMKSSAVSVSNALNSYIWKKSRQKPPRRVKVRALKEDAKVRVYLHDEQEQKPKKAPAKKEEKPPAEGAKSASDAPKPPKEAVKEDTKPEKKAPAASGKKEAPQKTAEKK